MPQRRIVAAPVAAIAAAFVIAGDAAAQLSLACPGTTLVVEPRHGCRVAARQASSVGRPAEPKDQFVNALREFLEAIGPKSTNVSARYAVFERAGVSRAASESEPAGPSPAACVPGVRSGCGPCLSSQAAE